MTARAVDDELDRVLGMMSRRYRGIQEKVEKNVLPREYVLAGLQALHDGKFAAEGAGTIVVPQRPKLIRGMYTPPDVQLANVPRWASQRLEEWKDVPIESWLARLGPAPDWPSGRHQAVVLAIALPDLPESKDAEGKTIPAIPGYVRTARDLWTIISAQHPRSWKYEQFLLDAEHLFLLDGATYEPGLCWRVLDLGANWDKVNGIAPATVRNAITSPNVDGFAALANHPRYVRRMDGVRVPYIWISGFQVAVPGNDPRRLVPNASFLRDGRGVHLGAHWDDHSGPYYAVPSRLGVRS